ncbi:hypothetical protein [Paractinoplanes hotanensis]|uniref:Uncharacterized protein n=1 Tax=Paractinoplanes hotanensis TaxID=2906497 RepID=A0ABT0Y3S6_9ACTN|nr:hypothetical protein [Actinoplanes hotanensis]MCM4080707.1 hypothetical protein [Actinoplanes hotanensis]
MTSDEKELRRLLHAVGPALPEPENRIAAVSARVRRTRRAWTGGALAAVAIGAALVAGLPGLVGQSDGGTPAAGQATPGTVTARTDGCDEPSSAPADQAGLADINNRLWAAGEARFADSFGETLTLSDRVRVFRKPSTEFDSWVKGEFRAACVEMANSVYSARGVQAILDRVEADRAFWESKGLAFRTLSVDVNGTITVGVDPNKVDRAQTELQARYDNPVVVEPQKEVAPATGTD